MKVPFLDLSYQNRPLESDILAATMRVVRSGKFILGPEVQSLEEEIAYYCSVPHAIGVSSGTDALLVALMALGLRSGEGVITTTFSFFATAGAIVRLGAVPIFVDIDPETFNMDSGTLQHAWAALKSGERSSIRAILPVHLFGQCADMNPILEFGRRYGLTVIEDAAQSLGAEYSCEGGKEGEKCKAGTMGQMGCFSFFPSKNLGGFGDGGMVITSDASLAERLRVLRAHGAKPKYYHEIIGGNFRLDSLQAAVLSVKLKRLDHWHRERRENAARYGSLFMDRNLQDFIKIPLSSYENQQLNFPHIYNQYIIRARRRDALRAYLATHEIGTAIYYPLSLHRQACFYYLGRRIVLPKSERAAREVLALPIAPGLTSLQQEYVVDAIKKFYWGMR